MTERQKNTESVRVYTRIVLELKSPASIGVGEESFESDAPFVTSASALPMLPATSLAGLLRAAIRRTSDNETADKWFGYQSNDAGHASRIRISNAHVHDENNRPVDRRLLPADKTDFLSALSIGEVRDHVAIGHHGAAKPNQKFDRQYVLAGTRFTFDLEITGRSDEVNDVKTMRDELLVALQSQATRLGGRKYAGAGSFHVVSAIGDVLDLKKKQDFAKYSQIPVQLSQPCKLTQINLKKLPGELVKQHDASLAEIKLSLSPKTFFLIGGEVIPSGEGDEKGPDVMSVRTTRVSWNNEKGRISNASFYLPATSLKGALSHRVAFHYNCLKGQWADEINSAEDIAQLAEDNAGVREIFGFANDDGRQTGPRGRAGRLIVEDVCLEHMDKAAYRRELTHVSIDPFTSGAKTGFLYTEEVIAATTESFEISLFLRDFSALTTDAKTALKLALEDLAEGHLALGGGYNRGNGHFGGQLVWPKELDESSQQQAQNHKQAGTSQKSMEGVV